MRIVEFFNNIKQYMCWIYFGEIMEIHKEEELWSVNGFFALAIMLMVTFLVLVLVFFSSGRGSGLFIVPVLIWALGASGFFVVNPNDAAVVTFMGKYIGTQKESGFFFAMPFTNKTTISVKVKNLALPQIKVNDKSGNPIEIGGVFTWRVNDTAAAAFAVQNVDGFFKNQCESALRNVAMTYNYDSDEDHMPSLRNSTDDIVKKIKQELGILVHGVGVTVEDAKITHLAYATEVAQVMLKKQQAEAVIAARKKIVTGATEMVESVFSEVEKKKMVDFTNEDKVRLLTNLMTVLVSDSEAQPVINLDRVS